MTRAIDDLNSIMTQMLPEDTTGQIDLIKHTFPRDLFQEKDRSSRFPSALDGYLLDDERAGDRRQDDERFWATGFEISKRWQKSPLPEAEGVSLDEWLHEVCSLEQTEPSILPLGSSADSSKLPFKVYSVEFFSQPWYREYQTSFHKRYGKQAPLDEDLKGFM